MGVLKENSVGTVQHVQDNTSSALNNGSNVALKTQYDNTTALGFTHSARLTTNGWGSTTSIDGTPITLYMVPLLDTTNIGTNPVTGTSAGTWPPGTWSGTFMVEGTGTTQYLDVQGMALGPYKYQPYVNNGTGQQMSAGWLVDIYPETEQY